jgi:membrane protein DedA with SNARE-associated domain
MGDWIDRILAWMTGLPEGLVYLVVGAFAFVENVFPPVPADVVALFGGFLAGQGAANPWMAFLVVWLGNVAGALLMYALGRRYGPSFFHTRVGRIVLHPDQVRKLAEFYERRGTVVILVSRFLPMFRAVVPVFAGTTGLGAVRTAIPIAVASGAWYGIIVYLGATAGSNWEQIRAAINTSGRWLALAAGVLAVLVGLWWWRSRRGEPQEQR